MRATFGYTHVAVVVMWIPFAVVGSYCANRFQCNVFLGDTVECRNSQCQCAVGYTLTDDGLSCRTSNASSILSSILVIVITLAVIIFE